MQMHCCLKHVDQRWFAIFALLSHLPFLLNDFKWFFPQKKKKTKAEKHQSRETDDCSLKLKYNLVGVHGIKMYKCVFTHDQVKKEQGEITCEYGWTSGWTWYHLPIESEC